MVARVAPSLERVQTNQQPNIDKQALIPVELNITANLSLFLAV